MWDISIAVSSWLETHILPFAYQGDYEDPVCPSAKLPIRILEIAVTIPCFLLDVVLIPVYFLIDSVCQVRSVEKTSSYSVTRHVGQTPHNIRTDGGLNSGDRNPTVPISFGPEPATDIQTSDYILVCGVPDSLGTPGRNGAESGIC